MIGPVTPSAAPAGSPAAALSPERRELREAAQGFEAIMLRRILESARSSPFAADTPLTGGGLQQFTAMRDEHFAEIASQTGTLGFARSIEEQLAQSLPAKRPE
ncbi:flagellar biosynthesis protein FlgJ [Erythrobacter sp.]|uniref:flagellar biosynthesis protein FlgJ n=1 Tax=Erythrobacter sp. TaxID=1042 RepID=UPI002EC6FFDF|nr:flagellar biosynthesis protein FlgJ [Erythrobacter sp.]